MVWFLSLWPVSRARGFLGRHAPRLFAVPCILFHDSDGGHDGPVVGDGACLDSFCRPQLGACQCDRALWNGSDKNGERLQRYSLHFWCQRCWTLAHGKRTKRVPSLGIMQEAQEIPWRKVQSFSNAVHPLWRSYDLKVAHVFRAEDDDREPRSPLIVPWRPVDRVRCYPPLDKNGSDKNGERL